MERDRETAGDYGYDLAHEETGQVTAPDDRTDLSHDSSPPASGKDELSGDLGYDEAHGF